MSGLVRVIPIECDWRLWAALPAHVAALVVTDARRRVSTVARPTFPRGVCRDCGCTESDACVDVVGECCSWTDKTQTRCSFCRAGVVRWRGRR